MRILLLSILLAGLLTSVPTAIAADPLEYKFKCSLFPTQSTSEEESHYINPKQISSLTILTDTSKLAVGTSGRYILMVSMTNGDTLLYGRYKSNHLRKNSIKYIFNIVLSCNQ